MKRSLIGLFVAVGVVLSSGYSRAASPAADAQAQWITLPPADKQPASFEWYLMAHPEDEARRIAALVWYHRRDYNFARLRYHTLEMVKYHPDDMHIKFENTSAFYAHPAYLHEVIQHMEARDKTGSHGSDFYWVLALLCQQAAMPPLHHPSAIDRARFCHYFGLPPGTPLRTVIDPAMAAKAVGYYRSAIGRVKPGTFEFGFYSEQLAGLLQDLGRTNAAIAVCQRALPTVDSTVKAALLLTFGSSLRAAHRTAEAKTALSQVRAADHEGFNGGPGHATTRAETELGLLALDAGDIVGAEKHLLASTEVEPCPHSVSQGLPLTLARRLLAVGQHDAVAKYCRIALQRFAAGEPATLQLLHQAEARTTARKPAAVHSQFRG